MGKPLGMPWLPIHFSGVQRCAGQPGRGPESIPDLIRSPVPTAAALRSLEKRDRWALWVTAVLKHYLPFTAS